MNDTKERLQIGEFARLADTNLRTLRYYEELGLLTPASRSAGGFRYYERRQLDRMVAIKRLQDLGLSLKEIARCILDDGARDTGGPDRLARLRDTLQRQARLTEARIEGMKRDLEELEISHRRLVEMCEGCDLQLSRENCDPCRRGHEPLSSMIMGLL